MKTLYISEISKLISKIKQYSESLIGEFLSNKLNKNKNSFRFLECLLPNNGIFSKYELILMKKMNNFNHFINESAPCHFKDSFRAQNFNNFKKPVSIFPDNVILLGPKAYMDGKYLVNSWWEFYNYMNSKNINVKWIDLLEDKSINKFNLSHMVNSFFPNKDQKNVLFIDPLAAPETFLEYRNIEAEVLHKMQTRSNFRVIGLLGDIWREKDRRQILDVESYYDGYIHTDKIVSTTYPKNIQDKFYFFHFDAFDSGIYEPTHRKENTFFFSGQVRDSDRRYWLRNLINLSVLYDIKIENQTWYRYASNKALKHSNYVEKLNSTQFLFSLSQKGKKNWVMTGRSKQALLSGCTLIHQENPESRMFDNILTPYVDYLPFSDVNELHEVVRFIKSFPNESRAIGMNGAIKFRQAFPERYFWEFCIGSN